MISLGEEGGIAVERILRFEADGFHHGAGEAYPGREMAEHLAGRLAVFATIVSGPEERDHGWDVLCEFEGQRVWVLLQGWGSPGWSVRVG